MSTSELCCGYQQIALREACVQTYVGHATDVFDTTPHTLIRLLGQRQHLAAQQWLLTQTFVLCWLDSIHRWCDCAIQWNTILHFPQIQTYFLGIWQFELVWALRFMDMLIWYLRSYLINNSNSFIGNWLSISRKNYVNLVGAMIWMIIIVN